MIYYRGPNWIPNRQQPTAHNQQSELGKDQQKEPSDHQKETLSGDLLRTIQNLNLLMDQMHRQPQNWIVQKPTYTTAKWHNPTRPSTILSGLSDDPQ